MNNVFNILDEIIDIKFKIQNSGGEVIFKEFQQENGKCEKVKISTSNKIFAMSLDNDYKVFNCFNNRIENITKKNDGILIFEYQNKIVVLLIELKSLNEGEYLKQLKAGKNFIEYLFKQINLFYPISIDENNIVYIGILFKTFRKTPSKNTTKREKIKFIDRNGLLVTWLKCNNNYKLQQFKDSIGDII
jgi:hypothetical protein